MEKERRYGKRKKTRNVSVSLHLLDPQVWFRYWSGTEYIMRDLSMIGIGVFTKEKIPVGVPLGIELRLGNSTKDIRIFGRVVWIDKVNDEYRAGVSFSWWQEDQEKKVLNKFLGKLINSNSNTPLR